MIPWALRQIRERLAPMLRYAGGDALVPRLDEAAIESATKQVAQLAEEAAAELARRPR